MNTMEEKNAQKKRKGRVIVAVAALVVAAVALFGVYQAFVPTGEAGAKEITVIVVHGDKSEKDFTYETDEAYLGGVLKTEGLIDGEESQYGLFIKTVDGETADDSKQQWWSLTKDGERVNTGVDEAPIEDGDQFELTLIEGY